MRRFLDWTQANPANNGNGTGQPFSATTATTATARRGSQHQSQSSVSISPTPSKQQLSNQTKDLELQHLTKLLHEIKYYQASSSPLPTAVGSQNQRDFIAKVHKTLPLFLNVFGTNIGQSITATQHNQQQHHQHSQSTTSLTYVDKSASQVSLLDDWSTGGGGGGGGSSSQSSKPSSPLPPSSPQMEKFPDLLPFAFTIARLFVSEVRQRASDKHAEDASLAILQFLSCTKNQSNCNKFDDDLNDQHVAQNDKDFGQGWKLLLALNTLASSQSQQIIQLLCDASLPSTLIKCLYLFFDLPIKVKQSSETKQIEDSADKTDDTGYNVATSSTLIKSFTQLLVQLCSYQSGIDELIKKDDLRLLIGIASSQCAPQNRAWRKTAFLALLATSKNMRDNFMYLEQNICIQVYVENMHRINSLNLATTEDLVDMVRVLMEFLYNLDVNNRNQPRSIGSLIEQYKSSRILDLVDELLVAIDDSINQEASTIKGSAIDESLNCSASQQPSVSSEVGICIDDYRRYGKRLVHSFVTMAKIHYSQEVILKNTTLKPLAMSRFDMFEHFKMPRPSSRECILNNEAIRFLKMTWSRSKDPFVIEAVLDSTIQLFNDDKYNYFVFESQQLLVYYLTSANFYQLPCKLKHKLYKFLEFIIIETNYIPCLELGTLGTILKAKNSTDSNKTMILKTLVACLRFNSKFSDIFREIGLLEIVIELLIENMQSEKLGQTQEKLELLYLLLEASQYLLTGPNNLNCTQYNESGAARHVFNCLSKPKFFHLFVPPHSSSSDDGGPISNASRTSTPTPTSISKNRHIPPIIYANHHWMESGLNKVQSRPSIKQMQKVSFTIIRQLILSSAGDEHLANLLGLLARNVDDLKRIEEQDETQDNYASQNRSNVAPRMDLTFLVSQEINLKIYILKSLMIIMKDSHRCRTLFRKVGGFIYIVSALITIERALPLHEHSSEQEIECHSRWRNVNARRIWRLIKNSFMTLIVAMRLEPMNLRIFTDEVMDKFVDAVRKLGCFNSDQMNLQAPSKFPPRTDHFDSFKSIFLSPSARDFSTLADENTKPSEACCQLFRFLYDMSLNMADGTSELEEQLLQESDKMFKGHYIDSKSISFDQGSSELTNNGSGIYKRRSHLQKVPARLPSLDLNICNSHSAILTFPCIILCILDLIPSCPNEDLMIFVSMIVKSLFKHERNQQLLCEAGVISKLLGTRWMISITDKNHFLHNISEFMFEKLTKQAITPRELRMFLRLGNPLCCTNLDDVDVDATLKETAGPKNEKIKTSQIETFVAMMTEESTKIQPPFVEFDMSTESCTSIFMPSIAPVNAKSLSQNACSFLFSTLDVHTNEKNGILGGVGSTERSFPPSSGLTFSTWVCIEKFPSRSSDASHNIRLLTIYRGSAATGKEYSCLRIQVSALDRALTISTQEALLFDNENKTDVQHDPDCFIRIWTPDTLFEEKWHHIATTIRKSSARQSSIHVYVDGMQIHNQRISYISSLVGPTSSGALGLSSGNNSPAAFVNAFIGSLPQIRLQTTTRWKQGPCHLVEEPLEPAFISAIYSLGHNFIGNFQGSRSLRDLLKSKHCKSEVLRHNNLNNTQKHLVHQSTSVNQSPRHGIPLTRVPSSGITSSSSIAFNQQQSIATSQLLTIGEDKMLVSLDARSTSLITLSRMRRIYTRFDCRQVSRFLGIAMNENSTPLLLLHNASIHLNGSSRTIGALAIGHDHVRCFVPSPTEQTLFSLGGCYVLIGFVAQSESSTALQISLKTLVRALKCDAKLQTQMDNMNGYQILSVMLWKKKTLLGPEVLDLIFLLIVTCQSDQKLSKINGSRGFRSIEQTSALRNLICESFDLWLQTDMITSVLEFIHDLISSSNHDQLGDNVATSSRAKNLKFLRDMDLLPRMLSLLPRNPRNEADKSETKSNQTFDTKAIYLIKQTVFELLNRTPRQSDILYFGQYLASLLPASQSDRAPQTISLRNILLKSLLQMMTRNKQQEVNNAMQEELVRILGFDWFMLFIHNSHLDAETITLGFLNLMLILSNEELYDSFKKGSSINNGGWLKEPIFPTIDGKYNIQMLGINYGVFFGLGGKRRAIHKEIFKAPNFFLLTNCLRNLNRMPRIYLMIFQAMMGRLVQIDAAVLDSISAFEKLNLDALCDSLIGETRHKRRQTLSSIKFRSLELTVSVVHMIRDIMCDLGNNLEKSENYPADIIRFFMYLYNNNNEFQDYCRKSDELIAALSEALMHSEVDNCEKDLTNSRQMITHPASKELLELSRLIILDRMTEPSEGDICTAEQMHSFEKFLDSLEQCREAQGELVDYILRQILLLIDSTARHNSIKTIGALENIQQFQLLLVNSIAVSETVTDKIWLRELYSDNLNRVNIIIDHMLCLAEQIYKFNEIFPKHNPPYAFIMQRVLNRILLFALSRPSQHISDKMLLLDLLKKIHDNRNIIILLHMHSPHSAEFFVCMTYCLLNIIEDTSLSSAKRPPSQQGLSSDQPASLIERQFSNPSPVRTVNDAPSSSVLLILSMAKKVWDALYQSKKGILSEAFDVSLSLPAFSLDTSPDLVQLKPDIKETCERYWSSLVETENKPKKRLQLRQNEPTQPTATSAAVNILSGRLTRVVNAANFVSRVVGATAGSMASNVNMTGDRSQNRANRKELPPQRSPSDLTSSSSTNSRVSEHQQQSISALSNAGDQSLSISQEIKREQFKHPLLSRKQILDANQTHISIIEDFIQGQTSQKDHKFVLHKYLCDEWSDIEYEVLLRERALFGPDFGSKLDKWCLDLTEGPRRMRKKMVNNTKQFFKNYAYQSDLFKPSNKSMRHRPPISYDSHLYYLKTLNLDQYLLSIRGETTNTNQNELSIVGSKRELSVENEGAKEGSKNTAETSTNVGSSDISGHTPAINIDTASPTRSVQGIHSSSLESISSTHIQRCSSGSPRPSEIDQDDGDSTSFVDFSPEIEAENNSARESENIDSLSVLRLLEKNERISHMFRCSRVQGLDTYEGLLLFGKDHFYLIDGFTLLKTREVRDIDSLPSDAHDPIIPNSTPNIQAHSKKTCAKFSFDSVIEVHKRRYLLQPIALEVFSSDGRNALIVFPRSIRNKVYSRIMQVATQITSDAHKSLAGQKSNVSVEGGSGLLSNLMGETSVTQRWIRGEISNFQYLMNLNTIAGRSYNDLMQYPIFPWILADYTSDCLDLKNSASFRDLSRPVGAQTSERLDQFKRRFAEWDDNETPPYHYGTFYSSAMIVASYMVRMEPFTQHFLRLQGGHFDLADRMFHSINDSWMSASKHNMADIKELIPEFFYLPEFLNNDNKYDLGIKQNGMRLNDVILPPWAKGDAREFIRLHRCALESDYVSAHLHEWIDLIFGYKQQGQAAVDAVNVFHHLFYEGNVDIYNTDIDPIKKNAVIGFINNFGQVPKQLFKKPHPVRKVTNLNSSGGPGTLPITPILPSLAANSNSIVLHRTLTHCPQLLHPVNSTIKDLRGPVGQIVQVDKNVVAVEQNKLLIPPEYCRYVAWGHADRSLRLGLYDSEKPIYVWEGSDNLQPNEILCCTIPNSRTMVTAGTESLVTVWEIEKMRLIKPITNLYGHVEPVTCLASSQPYSIIVSGSRDRTAIIWDLNRLKFVRQLGGGLSEQLVHHGPVSAIAINDSTGDIATCASSWLYLWTINGELLAQVDSFSVAMQQSMGPTTSMSSNINQLHILSVCFSQLHEWDLDEVIITGASDGSVALWSMRYYQCPMTEAQIEAQRVKTDENDRTIIDTETLRKNQKIQVEPESQNTDSMTEQSRQAVQDHQTSYLLTNEDSIKVEQNTSRIEQSNAVLASEPIEIKGTHRQRTDTMNSEWVRLSTSSASNIETSHMIKASHTSPPTDPPSEVFTSSDFLASGDSFFNDQGQYLVGPLTPLSVRVPSNDNLGNAALSLDLLASRCDNVSLSSPTNLSANGNDNDSAKSSSKTNLFLSANDPSLIKFSKSDTSLVESFVLLDESSPCAAGSARNTGVQARPQSSAEPRNPIAPHKTARKRLSSFHRADNRVRTSLRLQPNHCWRRELYLRTVLNRRQGKMLPAPVTSLTISKDHKILYIGDASGRIKSWTTT